MSERASHTHQLPEVTAETDGIASQRTFDSFVGKGGGSESVDHRLVTRDRKRMDGPLRRMMGDNLLTNVVRGQLAEDPHFLDPRSPAESGPLLDYNGHPFGSTESRTQHAVDLAMERAEYGAERGPARIGSTTHGQNPADHVQNVERTPASQ